VDSPEDGDEEMEEEEDNGQYEDGEQEAEDEDYDEAEEKDDENYTKQGKPSASDDELLAKMKRRQGSNLAITNNDILFPTLNYIDETGKYHSDVPKEQIMPRIAASRKSDTPLVLVLVAPRQRIARIFPIKEYQAHLKRARDQARFNKLAVKSIQLTWNISESDLDYRLKRGVDDLKKGHRLDIMLGARKAKLMRDRDERDAMLEKIRNTFEPWGYEWTKMSGGFPNAELWFQGYTEEDRAEMEKKKQAASNGTARPFNDKTTPRPWELEDVGEITAEGARDRHFKSINKKYETLFPEKTQIAGGYWDSLIRKGAFSTGPVELSNKEKREKEKEKKIKEWEEKRTARKGKEEEAKKEEEEQLRILAGKEKSEAREKLLKMAEKLGAQFGNRGKSGGLLGISMVKDVWGKYDAKKDKRVGRGATF